MRELAAKAAASARLDVLRDRDGRLVSPAEQLSLFVRFLARSIEEKTVPPRVEVTDVLGPSERPPATEVADLPSARLPRRAPRRLRPAGRAATDAIRVFAGAKKIAPADFLRAAASVASAVAGAGPGAEPTFPDTVAVPSGTVLATERFVAEDTPELFGDWIIHAEGFRAPRIVEVAKLQAWTLKPAER